MRRGQSGCREVEAVLGETLATSHSRTSSTAGALFSITFWLCSGDFEASAAFSSIGLSV